MQDNKKEIKQTIEGFIQFFRGICDNPNLVVSEELAEKYDISPEYRKGNTDREEQE